MTDKPKPPETPGMAEVSPKFIDEAEAAVEAAAWTDETLSSLWQEHERLEQQFGEAAEENDLAFTAKQAITDNETPEYHAAVEAHEAASQYQREISDATVAIENHMAKVPARTVAGVLLKLRVVGIEIAGASLNSEKRLTLSALADLERLASTIAPQDALLERLAGKAVPIGAVSVIEDPVLALKREWEARWGQYTGAPDDSDETTNPLHDRVNETAYEIFQTPATTLAGVAFKLVLWARQHIERGYEGVAGWTRPPVESYHSHDLDHLPVVSALHDLERMVGEGAVTHPTTPTDSHLLSLERRWNEINARRRELKADDAEKDDDHPDVLEDERLFNERVDIEIVIAKAPAHTAAGVAIKLRQLQINHEAGEGGAAWDAEGFRTSLEALERLAGES